MPRRRFNAGLDSVERTIVTSTGPYIGALSVAPARDAGLTRELLPTVAWNFRHVKQGNTSNYTLRRFSENVVADQFRFGGDREIIVTLPGALYSSAIVFTLTLGTRRRRLCRGEEEAQGALEGFDCERGQDLGWQVVLGLLACSIVICQSPLCNNLVHGFTDPSALFHRREANAI